MPLGILTVLPGDTHVIVRGDAQSVDLGPVSLQRARKPVFGDEELHAQRTNARKAASGVRLSASRLGPASTHASTWRRYTSTKSSEPVGKWR